jgi:hypothetical protein
VQKVVSAAAQIIASAHLVSELEVEAIRMVMKVEMTRPNGLIIEAKARTAAVTSTNPRRE